MADQPNILATELMYATLDVINQTYTGLPADDPTRLELVEIRPRSGNFSKVPLSCSIAPNDPADPGSWVDEELASPGKQYNLYSGAKYVEMGLGQYFNYRYKIDFTFFFMQMPEVEDKNEALIIAQLILERIHVGIIKADSTPGGRYTALHASDDLGIKLINASRAVKKKELRPGGSGKKTLYKGQMWLQFEAYLEE